MLVNEPFIHADFSLFFSFSDKYNKVFLKIKNVKYMNLQSKSAPLRRGCNLVDESKHSSRRVTDPFTHIDIRIRIYITLNVLIDMYDPTSIK